MPRNGPKAPAPDKPQQDRIAGLSTERRGSRQVTALDPQVALRVIESVANGFTVAEATDPEKFPGAPAMTTFYRWMVENPALREAFNAARELSAFFFEEEALYVARQAAFAVEAPTTNRMTAIKTYIDQLRWSASKRNARVYSDKGTLNVTVPIQINTSLDLGDSVGKGAAAEIPNIYTLEASVPIPDAEPAGAYESADDLIDSIKVQGEGRGPHAEKRAHKEKMLKRLERLNAKKDGETNEA